MEEHSSDPPYLMPVIYGVLTVAPVVGACMVYAAASIVEPGPEVGANIGWGMVMFAFLVYALIAALGWLVAGAFWKARQILPDESRKNDPPSVRG